MNSSRRLVAPGMRAGPAAGGSDGALTAQRGVGLPRRPEPGPGAPRRAGSRGRGGRTRPRVHRRSSGRSGAASRRAGRRGRGAWRRASAPRPWRSSSGRRPTRASGSRPRRGTPAGSGPAAVEVAPPLGRQPVAVQLHTQRPDVAVARVVHRPVEHQPAAVALHDHRVHPDTLAGGPQALPTISPTFEDDPRLSGVALRWMVGAAAEAGLVLKAGALDRDCPAGPDDAHGPVHRLSPAWPCSPTAAGGCRPARGCTRASATGWRPTRPTAAGCRRRWCGPAAPASARSGRRSSGSRRGAARRRPRRSADPQDVWCTSCSP